jgi:hypothetical protein
MLLDAIYQSNQIAKDQTSRPALQPFARGSHSSDSVLLSQQHLSSHWVFSFEPRVAASPDRRFENDLDFFPGRKSFLEDF